MLVEKAIEPNDIVAVKLVSGDEVIAKVTAIAADGGFKLSKPLVLGMQQHQDPATGKIGIGLGFAPFMLGLAEDMPVTIKPTSFVTVARVRDEVRNAYLQSTTGLEVPQSKLVV